MTAPSVPAVALAEAAALVAAAIGLSALAFAARTWAEFRARRRRQLDPLSRRHAGGANVLTFPPRGRGVRKRFR